MKHCSKFLEEYRNYDKNFDDRYSEVSLSLTEYFWFYKRRSILEVKAKKKNKKNQEMIIVRIK